MKVFWAGKRLAFASAVTTWEDVEQLKALGITHVVNLRHGKHGRKIREFKNLWLPFKDDKKPRPNWFYEDAVHFYQKAKRKTDTKILVFCHHGVCRSPSLVYLLLRLEGFTPTGAKSTVLKARRSARIIPAYERSSEDFLSLYKVQQVIKGKDAKS